MHAFGFFAFIIIISQHFLLFLPFTTPLYLFSLPLSLSDSLSLFVCFVVFEMMGFALGCFLVP